ncbi:MAG: transposase [Duncaniella sp.]|nr:transposase [Duncaniella sp.]
MSRNLIYLHYVFTPKKRQGIIDPARERELFAYIMGITDNLGGKLIRINAAWNHIHLLVKLPTTVTASNYIATVKRSTSIHIREKEDLP